MGKEQFIGTWRLVSLEIRGPDGEVMYPMGQNPRGVLMYDANGEMAVQLMNPADAQRQGRIGGRQTPRPAGELAFVPGHHHRGGLDEGDGAVAHLQV